MNQFNNKSFSNQFAITTLFCATSIALFVLQEFICPDFTYVRLGAVSYEKLANGEYWRLITCNFLHIGPLHLIFNLYWMWLFGRYIESTISKGFYIVLLLSAGLASSLIQMGFSFNTGVGLSGIGYALFGFLFIRQRLGLAASEVLDQRTTQLFLAWIVIGIVLNETGTLNIGNAAHIGGLLWGAFLGYVSKQSLVIKLTGGAIVMAFFASTLLWSPFSVAILSMKAYASHESQDLEKALHYYDQVLDRDPENQTAALNYSNIKTYHLTSLAEEHKLNKQYAQGLKKLEEALSYAPDDEDVQKRIVTMKVALHSQRAYNYHSNAVYDSAIAEYNAVLKLDSSNAWALENKSRIPNYFK